MPNCHTSFFRSMPVRTDCPRCDALYCVHQLPSAADFGLFRYSCTEPCFWDLYLTALAMACFSSPSPRCRATPVPVRVTFPFPPFSFTTTPAGVRKMRASFLFDHRIRMFGPFALSTPNPPEGVAGAQVALRRQLPGRRGVKPQKGGRSQAIRRRDEPRFVKGPPRGEFRPSL